MAHQTRRRPATPHGANTYEVLLQVGATVLAQRGLRRASVAEICRRSRVANGTFYQYFRDKEQLFFALMERMTHSLLHQISDSVQADICAAEQILAALRAHFGFIRAHKQLYRVFREAEFVKPQLDQRLYQQLANLYQKLLRAGAASGQLRPLDTEPVAYALLGLTEFLALRYIFWNHAAPPTLWETVRGFITEGISGKTRWTPALQQELLSSPKSTSFAEKAGATRARLLAAAERAFGEHGFYEAQIADIARASAVAHGTFYTYFASKEAIFSELVHDINAKLRAHSRAALDGLHDRREVERAGFRAFFDFIKDHPTAYRIIREAEFVGSPKNTPGRWYYERIAQGYLDALPAAIAAGQIRPGEPEPSAYMLMGIGHFIGLRWVVWEGQAVPAAVFETVTDFILNGLGKTNRRARLPSRRL